VSPGDAVSTGLLVLGSLVLVLASVGASLPRSPFVRLHYLSLSALVGAPLVVLGALVRDPGDWFKLGFVVLLLAGTSPVATAATARALERAEQEPEGSR
jgi:multisubunit Na+/H+ antiporter MnhG subunit